MTKLLVKMFIERHAAEMNPSQRRESFGSLSGIVGIVLNLLLGAGKLVIGLLSGSVAVMADAINNLTDAASSVATLIGFRIAAMKSDEKHPFGHARVEYMTGVIISAIVIVVGIRLCISSFEKITGQIPVKIDMVSVVFIAVLILVKIWMWRFNIYLAKQIDSSTIKATGIDSRNDVITSSVVLISLILYKLIAVDIDGYAGIAVAVYIVISGFSLVKETASPLLGRPPDPAFVRTLIGFFLKREGVMGVHDLIVHDYGPGHVFVTVHIEVDSHEDVMISHEMIDDIEREAKEKLGIELVCHMDPIDTEDPLVYDLRELVTRSLLDTPEVKGLHDFRIVRGPNRTNVIFDIVLSQNKSVALEPMITSMIRETLENYDPSLRAVINFDMDYTAEEIDKAFSR